MTWTLYVYIAIAINGQIVSVPTVLLAPIEFKTSKACIERGKEFVTPTTIVICNSKENQIEVRE